MNAIDTIRTFTKSWTKPGTTEERLYLDSYAACRFIGLEIQRYKSGSIKHASFDGETISNNYAFRIINSMVKAYYDVTSGKWYAVNPAATNLISAKLQEMAATKKPRNNELARRAMVRAHAIRRESAARLGCKASELCWSECLIMAWAEVKAA